MKIIKSNFQKGFVKIRIDTEDDVWYLKSIIEPGDSVKARTMRSVFIERDKKKIKTGKRPMMLKIRVEKIDFKEYGFQLRLTGKIIEGPEDVELGSYHTIEVDINTILMIEKKQWKKYQIEKLRKAQTKVPDVLIAVVDSTQATFGILKRSGLNIVSEFTNPYSIQQEEKMPEFYKKIATEIDKFSERVKKIILAGPGFTKEHVQRIIKERYGKTHEKLMIDTASSATKSGINEILKKGTLDRVIKESTIVEESKLIEDFFIHLKKEDGLSVYGLESIKQSNETGAIKTLLVSDEKIREEQIERLANDVEKKRGQIKIISTTHDLGEQFHRMGGLGAILRFRVF